MNSLTWPDGSGSLTRYVRAIRMYPMLSADEELALSRAWRDRQDLGAAHKLVTSHLRLVVRVAMGYRGYGLPIFDLINEGNVGMMHALRRFDPDRGFRLATYAMCWIRAAIQEYILRSGSLVKMGTTGAQKKLFFNLRRLKGQMRTVDDGDLQPSQIAHVVKMLRVPERDVISMNRRMAAPDLSLNVMLHESDGGEWQDSLVDDASTQEEVLADHEELAQRKTLLGQVFNVLSKREQQILSERWLKEHATTLSVLAGQYNISRERVRQIERRALSKLQKALQAQMAGRVVGLGSAHAGLSVAMS